MESEIMVYVPGYNEYPLDKAWKRMAGHEEQLKRLKAAQQKAIPTFEEYLEKIAQPQINGYIKFLNPEFVSSSGLNAEQLIKIYKAKVSSREAYENYCKGLSVEELMANLPQNTAAYVNEMTFGRWRLAGGLTPNGTSALKIIQGWLGGDKKIVTALRKQDKLLQGKPSIVTLPAQTAEFKRKLRTLLHSGLAIIQYASYDPATVDKQNDRLKQLVDCYVRPEFVVSLNWMVILTSGRPFDSKEVKEIIYKIYESFLGEEKAKHLRDISIEREYQYPLNPEEYIGSPNKLAYFDMELFIQVSWKV